MIITAQAISANCILLATEHVEDGKTIETGMYFRLEQVADAITVLAHAMVDAQQGVYLVRSSKEIHP